MSSASSILFVVSLTLSALSGSDQYLAGHRAERSAKYSDAVAAYQSCIDAGGPLAPYAEVRLAFCRAASGDKAGAVERYRGLLKRKERGPWQRMAQAQLAGILAERKAYPEAASLYSQAFAFDPKPWWTRDYDRMNAEVCIELPARRDEGFAYFKTIVATALWRDPRIEAANILAKSPSLDDRLFAAWGLIKSGERTDALKMLLKLGPEALKGGFAGEDWADVGALLSSKESEASGRVPDSLRAAAARHRDSMWFRLILAFAARCQTLNGDSAAAAISTDLLLEHYPQSDQACWALYWCANRLSDEKKPLEAAKRYQQLAKEFPEHTLADDALFAEGRMFRSGKEAASAIKAFDRLAGSYPDSKYASCGLYWAGLLCKQSKDTRRAGEFFRRTADCGPGDFYTHRALLQLAEGKNPILGREIPVAGTKPFLRALALPPGAQPAIPQELRDDISFQRIGFFAANGLKEAEWEAVELGKLLESRLNSGAVLRLLGESGLAMTATEYADKFGWGVEEKKNADGRVLKEKHANRLWIDFPRAYWPQVVEIAKKHKVDPYLVLAVARQESTFRPALTSSAGASGVMQLMPATAQGLAKGDPTIIKDHGLNLEHPEVSLRLGVRYLAHMLERCDGNIVFALASYNAGPGNCAKWRKQFGNLDTEAFIEQIPFSETRDYVKKVLGNYAAYLSLYPPAS